MFAPPPAIQYDKLKIYNENSKIQYNNTSITAFLFLLISYSYSYKIILLFLHELRLCFELDCAQIVPDCLIFGA